MTDTSTQYQYSAYLGVIMNHIFDVDVAKQYGILEAVMLNNFAFWIAKNKANEAHFHDGKYWTYNTVSAFEELYPYATKKQIRNALDKLRSEGLIETGNFNENRYDRTLWYTLTEKGVSICRHGQVDLPYRANGDAPEGKPIPYINTDTNTDVNTDISIVGQDRPKIPYTDIVLYLNHVAGTSYKPSSKKTRDLIQARFNEGFTADDFKTVIDKKARDWRNDPKYSKFLRPETLFGTKFEGYLNQPMREPTTRDLADQFDYSDW